MAACWKRDPSLMHRQTWKDGKPPSTPPAENAPQVDVHSAERAMLIEKLCVLAGQTTWREPVGSFAEGHRPDTVPQAHTMAAGLAYARRRIPDVDEMRRIVMRVDPTDIGPDVLECLVYQRVVNGQRIRMQLTRALRDMSSKLAKADEDHVWKATAPILRECATGVEAGKPFGVPKEVWNPASSLGIMLLWASAGQTLRALAEKLG